VKQAIPFVFNLVVGVSISSLCLSPSIQGLSIHCAWGSQSHGLTIGPNWHTSRARSTAGSNPFQMGQIKRTGNQVGSV